jgi:hypothetical protein
VSGLPIQFGVGLAKKDRLMNATSIFLGLLIVLFMILLLRWMRKAKPLVTGVWITTDVPELRADHVSIKGKLECGKPFTAVAYPISKK